MKAKDTLIDRRLFMKGAAAATLCLPKWDSAYARRGRGALPGGNGFFPSGHWVAAQQPAMTVVYPRPDTETSSYARHRWAYYDGTNQIEYRIPIIVLGGAYPHVFTLLSGPAGMSIPQGSWIAGNTAAQMLALGYGDIVWTPQGNVTSATVEVQITGQDGVSTTATFTVSTSSSTSQFIFVDPAAASSGTGTISSPLKLLSDVFGASNTTTTFPGASVYLRNGTHAAYVMSGASGIAINATYCPMAILGYPGESPVIDITNGGAQNCFGFGSSGTIYDFFAQGFSMTGVASANVNEAYRHFWTSVQGARWTWHNISFPNVYAGQNAGNNSASIYFQDPGYSAGNFTNYVAIKGLSETNRTNPASGHSYGIFGTYATQYGVAELCSITGSTAEQNMYLKGSNRSWCRRYNLIEGSGSNFILANGDQLNAEGTSEYEETCYNVIVNTGGAQFVTRSNLNDQSSAVTNTIWYRNTIVGGAHSIGSQTGNGPFSYIDDVVQWGTTAAAAIYYYLGGTGYVDTLPLPSSITNTGTECQGASGIVDASYNLTGASASYAGKRGAQIQ